jgi:DNA-directed RNA polymerase specialized sigma24 family protein
MRAWLRSGEIFAKCQQRGWGSLHAPSDGRPWGIDEAEELALETVAIAIGKLEVAQEMGRLDPRTRGVVWGVASNYTYVEIAAMLGMDRKTVDNLLARHRSRCRHTGGVA